ncbi:hypothetical protein IAU60_002372 [Kwoniella sp. DSM 27419]
MQPDAHPHPGHHDGDTSSLPPSSPALSATFRHHPQPTPTVDTTEASQSRHRVPYLHADGQGGNLIRVSVQTPWGDSGHRSRRKEGYYLRRDVTVADLKGDLVAGRLEGAGHWEEDGMRLVYHGRIVRDHEALGDIVGKQSTDPDHLYTFHLVARRIPMTPMPMSPMPTSNDQPSQFPFVVAPVPAPAVSSVRPDLYRKPSGFEPPLISVNSLALSDSVHYLLFTSRHHLFELLNLAPLEWDRAVPPPTVTQDKAREAVMSVIRAYAEHDGGREEGWEDWEAAFDGETEEGLKQVWDRVGRDGLEKEIRSVWAGAKGTHWTSERDERVDVKVDGSLYTLSLPQLGDLTPQQLVHLLTYLRITTLLPLLNSALQHSVQQPSAHPTMAASGQRSPVAVNTRGDRNRRVVYQRTWRFRVPPIPMSTLSTLFFSGVRMIMMIWMLTRGMKWQDSRFWIIAGLAGGWWLVDSTRQIRELMQAEDARTRLPVAPRAPDAAGSGGENGNRGADTGPGENHEPAERPVVAPDANIARPGAQGRRGAERRAASGFEATSVPLFYLDEDANQLRLPPPSLRPPTAFARTPRSRPWRLMTQFFLPVLLWFVTLIPEWEAIRARAIRRRERAMRVLVNETQPVISENGADDGETESLGAVRPVEAVLPDGLSVLARNYYLRVMERGEGIDWEEEREAQRAMGVGEEDADEGDGMRLRML